MKIKVPAEEEATTSIKTKILTLKKKSRKEFLWKKLPHKSTKSVFIKKKNMKQSLKLS